MPAVARPDGGTERGCQSDFASPSGLLARSAIGGHKAPELGGTLLNAAECRSGARFRSACGMDPPSGGPAGLGSQEGSGGGLPASPDSNQGSEHDDDEADGSDGAPSGGDGSQAEEDRDDEADGSDGAPSGGDGSQAEEGHDEEGEGGGWAAAPSTDSGLFHSESAGSAPTTAPQEDVQALPAGFFGPPAGAHAGDGAGAVLGDEAPFAQCGPPADQESVASTDPGSQATLPEARATRDSESSAAAAASSCAAARSMGPGRRSSSDADCKTTDAAAAVRAPAGSSMPAAACAPASDAGSAHVSTGSASSGGSSRQPSTAAPSAADHRHGGGFGGAGGTGFGRRE